MTKVKAYELPEIFLGLVENGYEFVLSPDDETFLESANNWYQSRKDHFSSNEIEECFLEGNEIIRKYYEVSLDSGLYSPTTFLKLVNEFETVLEDFQSINMADAMKIWRFNDFGKMLVRDLEKNRFFDKQQMEIFYFQEIQKLRELNPDHQVSWIRGLAIDEVGKRFEIVVYKFNPPTCVDDALKMFNIGYFASLDTEGDEGLSFAGNINTELPEDTSEGFKNESFVLQGEEKDSSIAGNENIASSNRFQSSKTGTLYDEVATDDKCIELQTGDSNTYNFMNTEDALKRPNSESFASLDTRSYSSIASSSGGYNGKFSVKTVVSVLVVLAVIAIVSYYAVLQGNVRKRKRKTIRYIA